MIRFFFIVIILLALKPAIVSAQDNAFSRGPFSLGAELSLPVGIFGEVYSMGIGFSAQVNIPVGKHTSIDLYSRIINYYIKNTYGGGSTAYVPILLGVEQDIFHYVFGAVQAGITFRTQGLGNAFTYSPGIGVRIHKNYSVLFKYLGQVRSAINSGAVGVRLAYHFN